MKTKLLLCIVIMLLPQIRTFSGTGKNRDAGMLCAGAAVDAFQPGEVEKGQALAALEQKLVGSWAGPACGGDYTFRADGTFEVELYSRSEHPHRNLVNPLGRAPADTDPDVQDIRLHQPRPRPAGV
jgi:hypothetical protein